MPTTFGVVVEPTAFGVSDRLSRVVVMGAALASSCTARRIKSSRARIATTATQRHCLASQQRNQQ